MRRCVLAQLLAGFLPSPGAVSAAETPPPGDEFQTWLESLSQETELGTELKRQDAERLSQSAALAAAKGDTPFTLTSLVDRKFARPLDATKTTETINTYDAQDTLTAQTKGGLQANLVGSYAYNDINHVPFPVLPRRIGQKSLASTLRFFYDVVTGGKDGVGMTGERAQVASIERVLRDLDTAELQYRLSLHALLVNYYAITCKLQVATTAKAISNKTLDVTRIRYAAHLVSYTDYLNIVDAGLSIDQTIASTRQGQAETLGALAGTAPLLTPELLAKNPFNRCSPNLDEALARAKSAVLDPKQAVHKTPTYLSAAAALEAAKASLQLARLKERPALGPFVEGAYNGTPDSLPRTNASVSLGVSLTWTLPSGQTTDNVRATAIEVQASQRNAQIAEEAAEGNFRLLANRIRAQEEVLTTQRASLDNARKLLDATESQMAAGIVDSTTYNRVQLSSINAELGLLDIWSTLHKSTFELNLYSGYFKQTHNAGRVVRSP